jgi:hypothetical protein
VGIDFVNNIVKLNLEKCRAMAVEQCFQSQNTEEARKCMELLSVVAGWLRFRGKKNITKQIASLYDRKKVMRSGIKHKEFVADVLYMGFYSAFRKIDGSPVDEFDKGHAEFFRYVSKSIYESIQEKSFDNRLGLEEQLVLYSTSPEYYPYNVWPNWYK